MSGAIAALGIDRPILIGIGRVFAARVRRDDEIAGVDALVAHDALPEDPVQVPAGAPASGRDDGRGIFDS